MFLLNGNGIGETAGNVAGAVGETALNFVSDPLLLVGGIILIVIAVAVIFFLKKIIINSVLGVVVWGILTFLLGINLPFIPSLVVSAVFGLAGLGVLLLLRFMGLF